MAIKGVTQDQWTHFIQEGGELIAEIDRDDIAKDPQFWKNPEIINNLTTGFEIRPSTIVYESELGNMIEILGEPWARILAGVYRRGGTIIYRQLPNGKYEAKMTIPGNV